MLTITIDNRIRFDPRQIPADVLGQIQEACLLPNPDKAVARKQKIPGWQRQPDFIVLYQQPEPGEIWLPRGFANGLFAGFEELGLEPSITDMRTIPPVTYPRPLFGLRQHQVEAVLRFAQAAVHTWGCGILEAPPGSGKTVTTLELIRQAQTSACIVVNTTNIAEQWRERIKSYLGIDAGMIGDGTMDFREDGITLATVQSLYNLPFVHPVFEVGFACMDEVHHVSAMTFSAVMQRFTSLFRLGVSATPDRHTGWFGAVEAVIGPIVHRVTKQELAERGFLVRPTIHRVHTSFDHYYQGTQSYKAKQECDTPGCPSSGKAHSHRTNYTAMVGALAKDMHRAYRVARTIDAFRDGRHLVVSRRHEQLERIQTALEQIRSPLPTFMLTGKEKTEERMEAARRASAGPCVVFSTIADEALDIPELDHLHLAWPTKNPAVVTQQLGRVERAAPGKIEAHVWDYVDSQVGVLYQQSLRRRREVYEPDGYTILEVDLESGLDMAGRGD